MADAKTPQELDGWQAHRRCLPIASNPYNQDTQGQSHALWNKGWTTRKGLLMDGKATIEWDASILYV